MVIISERVHSLSYNLQYPYTIKLEVKWYKTTSNLRVDNLRDPHIISNFLTSIDHPTTKTSWKFSENQWAAMICEWTAISFKGDRISLPFLAIMLKRPRLCLCEDGQQVQTHKVILILYTMFFFDNLWQSYRQEKQTKLTFKFVFPGNLRELLQFVRRFFLIPFLFASLCLFKIMQVDSHFPG